MTDSSPGPGWWLANDGNWYAPHLHPNASAGDVEPITVPPETDAEILSAFRGTTGDAGTQVPDRTSPIDEIRATTGGGIDWEAVALERAAQREARNRSTTTPWRTISAAAVGVAALVAIVLIARNAGTSSDRTNLTLNSGTTVVAPTIASVASTTGGVASTSVASTTSLPATTSAASATTKAPSSTITTAATGATGTATNVSVFTLAAGSCIDQDNLTTGLVTTVRSVPCNQPHTHEVYLKTSVTPADVAYDAAKVTTFANQACTEGFKTYVGIAYEQSKYYFLHLAPSAESWTKNRDRDVVCLLLLEGQKLTTSVKGKGE